MARAAASFVRCFCLRVMLKSWPMVDITTIATVWTGGGVAKDVAKDKRVRFVSATAEANLWDGVVKELLGLSASSLLIPSKLM